MIKSMTGFGRYEMDDGKRKVVAEIRAVNHRHLDWGFKLPRKLGFLESRIRSELKDRIQRGKVDIYIAYEAYGEANLCVGYNKNLAAEYRRVLLEMGADLGLEDDIRIQALSRFPDILTIEENVIDEGAVWEHLRGVLAEAAARFVASRAAEGEQLGRDIAGKLAKMTANVDFIAARAPQVIAEYQDRLREKVSSILAGAAVDEARLLTEVALMADKSCLDEELVRLRSHIEAMAGDLRNGGAIGRKLDFLAQEMNREANTIAAKAGDIAVINAAIELKTEIEKIREQVQNIE